MVLEPLSYSADIPSFAFSAAFTCKRTAAKKLLEDNKFDHALATFVLFVLISLSNSNFFLIVKFRFLLTFAIFVPPE